ncbi:barstar family protein [Streptomyces goshikiensis]|uniref:barstar family protein n=1 Tax=Streptomyces TaxID=1883 RepID=UPI00093D4591|nr:barstar family protein [Streptomyces sp. CB03578]
MRRAAGQGLEVRHVDAAGFHSERDASLAIGRELDFPSYFRGGWDGFFDLLSAEFQEKPRRLVVGLLNSDALASRDLRLFVNTSWHLQNATETIESDGGGDSQLEFFYWGAWRPVGD